MEIRNIYEPFELEVLETQHYEAKEHRNTFFEMVFVLEGTGTQIINDHRLPYTSDKLFLIFPQDTHGFEISTTSRFFFLRFNDSYLKIQDRQWIHKLEFIFHNYNHLPGCILKTITDKPLVRSLVEALILEKDRHYPEQQEVTGQLVKTILTIAARNMLLIPSMAVMPERLSAPQALSLLNYIHRHIYDPEQLKARQIAAQFHISPAYISAYFKKQTGQSLQAYITSYKIKLIETKLRFSDRKISEIVDEFGFSDASHLNKLFRKYKGVSPTEYRKAIYKVSPECA